MNKVEFINEFEENVVFVEVGSLNVESILADIEEWDSMATVATIALIDEHFDITLKAEKLTSCLTLGDIIALIQHKLEG
ncbi:acyl carrier protein [Paenibacillus psychroresistens]|uniref:Acyl carrier protein n=1 Tax=Paenibacillus psychroresistens TaxID=1778678 RepID=A0A6B8RRI8_9BACL|nr:acyl carrier protein [Paenibacillus psychroresistens]QGQ98477.1 acyl carrier protein [Paenibacillus psychroresistens]